MKKIRLILSGAMLALAITFVSASSITAFASDNDPQGTVEKKPAPAAPAQPQVSASMLDILIMLLGIL
jgi:hypothetical protein